jgi:hypothetical protein
MATWQTLATAVLQKLQVIAAGETPSSAQSDTVLAEINRLLNNWNADRLAVYASAFNTYTLVPGLSPHTIGPSGQTFTVTTRPVSLDGATLVLTSSSPAANLPINIRDADWWSAQITPTIQSSVVTDVYYQPDWPNGKLFFWPVPSVAYSVQLMTRVVLSDTATLSGTFSLPPGYEDAIILTACQMAAPNFGAGAVAAAGLIREDARQARARIYANNDPTPSLQTADSGMQGPSHQRSTWNYLIGRST